MALQVVIAADFTVNSTANDGPGSLRWAITAANELLGPDTILFALPAGDTTIFADTALPSVVSDKLTIRGDSQPGYTAAFGPVVEVNCRNQMNETDSRAPGLQFLVGSRDSVLHAVRFVDAQGFGLKVVEDGVEISGCDVINPRDSGLFLNGADCLIQNNVFAGGSRAIIVLKPHNRMLDNRIGVNRPGTALYMLEGAVDPLRISGPGIFTLPNSAHHLVIKGNVIGGCGGRGLEHMAHSSTVQGNRIGVDATGRLDLGNGDGVSVSHESHSNLFGGPRRMDGNVVSGNTLSGFGIAGSNNRFENNVVGTDESGSFALPNDFQGIHTLGDNNTFVANLISGNNGNGLLVRPGSHITLVRNMIGTDISGVMPIPNEYNGITISTTGTVTIGGEDEADGNTIAFNGQDGVVVTTGNSQTRVLSNTIHSNGGEGIKHTVPGPLELALSEVSADGATVYGVIRSPAAEELLLQVFSSATCDGSAAGGDQVLVGWAAVETVAGTPVPFSVALAKVSTTTGQQFSATATSSRSTSPFSKCLRNTGALVACDVCRCEAQGPDALLVDCSGQGLRTIPPGLPTDTTRLLMGRNELGFMAATDSSSTALAALPLLSHLDLSESNIRELPANLLTNLKALRTLNLAGNGLSDLEAIDLEGTTALDTLDVSFNQLTALPSGYAKRVGVVSISLRNNRISVLPAGCLSSVRLQAIDIANNPIATVSNDAFRGSVTVQTIDLSGDAGTPRYAPQAFSGLPKLNAINGADRACTDGFGSGFTSSGLAMCLRCPDGSHKPTGEGSLLACEPCDAGTSDTDADPVTPCVVCGAGHYTPAGSVGECAGFKCPAGHVDHDASAATPCLACSPGTYAEEGLFARMCHTCSGSSTDDDLDPATPCVICHATTTDGPPEGGVGPCVPKPSRNILAIALGTTAAVLLIVFLLVVLWVHWKAKKDRAAAQKQIRDMKLRVNALAQRDDFNVLGNDTAKQRLRALEINPGQLAYHRDGRHQIGAGEFGVVWRGELRDARDGSTCTVAIKENPSTVTKDQEAFLVELQLTAVLQHPHIVRVLGMCTQSMPFMAVLEYMNCGDLQSHLMRLQADGAPPSQRRLVAVCQQIASALEYLKSRGVIHRDLAARNVLVRDQLETVKLADFGMSKALSVGDYFRSGNEKVAIKWLAPECLRDKKFTHLSDLWAFGVVMWEVFSMGDAPYAGMTALEIAMQIGGGSRLARPRHCPAGVYMLMTGLWMRQPEARLPIADVERSLCTLAQESEFLAQQAPPALRSPASTFAASTSPASAGGTSEGLTPAQATSASEASRYMYSELPQKPFRMSSGYVNDVSGDTGGNDDKAILQRLYPFSTYTNELLVMSKLDEVQLHVSEV